MTTEITAFIPSMGLNHYKFRNKYGIRRMRLIRLNVRSLKKWTAALKKSYCSIPISTMQKLRNWRPRNRRQINK